ncbi:MAG: agmatine deiminase family protein [Pseudomonadota bacterium]|nr:agmatine deiminase family protein [Pseudomonadota bacterium]MDE3037617.1 agmatine deiminase family protein [Pseudomonadota bacterium]
MRMPAEWETHASTLLAWPHHKNDWPGKFEPIPWVYAEIIRHLTRHERVRLVIKNVKEKAAATAILECAGVDLDKLDFPIIPTNRVWLRDSGPIYVKSGKEKIMLDWRFTAWAKYSNHQFDDEVPVALNTQDKIKRIQPMHKGRRVVLEGGSIDVNGKGTLLTTEECLLSKTQCRNPKFSREDYESVFEKYLGVSNVIWLGHGIEGDDTHGHIDDLARFVNPTTVVTVVEKNKKDVNYAPLQDNLKRLRKARDENGKPFTVVELPMPKPLEFEGARLPASYANFYIANGLVLAPTFNDLADRAALSILAELFPKREIIGIHAVDLVWGFGTLHCMSQQEPL